MGWKCNLLTKLYLSITFASSSDTQRLWGSNLYAGIRRRYTARHITLKTYKSWKLSKRWFRYDAFFVLSFHTLQIKTSSKIISVFSESKDFTKTDTLLSTRIPFKKYGASHRSRSKKKIFGIQWEASMPKSQNKIPAVFDWFQVKIVPRLCQKTPAS